MLGLDNQKAVKADRVEIGPQKTIHRLIRSVDDRFVFVEDGVEDAARTGSLLEGG